MVLVSYRLDNYISLLQTKCSDREWHEARRVGLETMPLDEHIKRRHSKREARMERRPAPMHHLFEMADERQHRQHRLHEHAVLPLAPLTEFEVGGIALRGMEGGITENDHLFFELSHQPLEGVIRDIRGSTGPSNYQTVLVQ